MAAQAGPYLGIQFQNGTSVQTTPFVAGYGGVDSQGGWMRSMCLASVLYVQVLGLQHELAKGNFAHPKKTVVFLTKRVTPGQTRSATEWNVSNA